MIKINLARKKQASYSSEETTSKAGLLSSLKSIGSSADSSDLVGILSKVLLPVVLCIISYFGYSYFIQTRLDEFQVEMANVEKEKTKVQGELKKISGFEVQKVELEKIGQTFGLKIKTIEQLILGKDHTMKSMIALSQSCPKDVWITEINATETAFQIRGNTTDMSLVSDVMAKLGTSIYFKDVSLKGSTVDSTGRQASFELSARRE